MGFGCNGIGWGGWRAWGGPGSFGFILNSVFWLGVLGLLALGAIWLARRLSRQLQASAAGDTPLETARQRLAAGEITVGEFDEMRDRLRRGAALVDR